MTAEDGVLEEDIRKGGQRRALWGRDSGCRELQAGVAESLCQVASSLEDV